MKIDPKLIIVVVLCIAVLMTHHTNMKIHEYKAKTEICMQHKNDCILEPLQ